MRLKELREGAGVSFAQAARTLSVNPTTIRRMEKADVGLKPVYVEKLLRSYGVPADQSQTFLSLVEKASRPGWWHRFRDVVPSWFSLYVSLEGVARRIRSYEPHCVPGLLQTEDYARAVLRVGFPCAGEEEIERRVSLRMERQSLLSRAEPPVLWTVLDETVLRRRVGSPDVMRGQLDRLAEEAQREHVRLQILPFDTGPHPGMFGPFQLFSLDVPELPDIVCTQTLTGAVYRDDPADVLTHVEALDRMCAQAAPPRETGRVLAGLRREL